MIFSLPNHYAISTDKNLLDVTAVHKYLSEESYWAKNIPLQLVQQSIDNSFCFGVYFHKELVGFARLVTDYSSFAYLCDVYILEAHRGQHLSKCLMQEIMNHPKLQGLRRWVLATADAHELYKQFGWQCLTKPERYLEIVKPNIYNK